MFTTEQMSELLREQCKRPPLAQDPWAKGAVTLRNHVANSILDFLGGGLTCAEAGVWEGYFSRQLMAHKNVKDCFLIDPWRLQKRWTAGRQPSEDEEATKMFEKAYQKTLDNTKDYKKKRIILRGKSTEVAHEIKDESLDFSYIDGDHTLRGITIDLAIYWSKTKKGGVIMGDDVVEPRTHCHNSFFKGRPSEPMFVFPYVLYFAEAHNCPLFLFGDSRCVQFIILKDSSLGFSLLNFSHTSFPETANLLSIFKQ